MIPCWKLRYKLMEKISIKRLEPRLNTFVILGIVKEETWDHVPKQLEPREQITLKSNLNPKGMSNFQHIILLTSGGNFEG